MPAVDPVSAVEWYYLDIAVLRPARSSKACVTLLTCSIHQGLIHQGGT